MRASLLVTALSLPIAAASYGEIFTFQVNLGGGEEVPPVITSATGLAQVMFDDVSFEITISGAFENLSSPVTVGHLHGLAAVGATAPPIFAFDISPDEETDGMSGSFFGMATLSAVQAQGVIDGLTYINIHSEMFTPGEIRGQVEIPAPGAAAALGLLGLAGLRRRR